jgi:hypothetical protein
MAIEARVTRMFRAQAVKELSRFKAVTRRNAIYYRESLVPAPANE